MFQKEAPLPDIEWWDKFIVVAETYDNVEKLVSQEEIGGAIANPKYREITHLIEHPVSKPPPGIALL